MASQRRLSTLAGHLAPQEVGWLGKSDQLWIELDQIQNYEGMKMSWMPDIGPVWCAWLALKQVLHIKQIPVILVHHPSLAGGEGEGPRSFQKLYELTSQKSFPVLWWEDERPRSAWLEQVQLADRVGPGPQLIPDDINERIAMFGALNELLSSEDGFCTHKRQMMINKMGETTEEIKPFTDKFSSKYQYVDPARASWRVVQVIDMIDCMLVKAEQRGSKFLIGHQLSLLDIFASASFAVMADPPGGPKGTKALPQEMFGRAGITMLMDGFRDSTAEHPKIQDAITDRVQSHRDFIISNYFEKAETYGFK